MKRTIGAGGVFLGALGMGVSEPVTVGTLGVAVSLGCFLDFEAFGEEEEGREEDGNVVGGNGDDHRSGLLGEPNSSALIKVPGRANRDLLGVTDGFFDKVEQLFVDVREDVGWDRVNCQLYGGWRLGKRKPGIVPTGKDWLRRPVRASK